MLPHIWNNNPSGQRGLIGKSNFRNKPTFKVNFPRDQLIGHSDFRMPKIDAKLVKPNFLSSKVETRPIYDVSEIIKGTSDSDDSGQRILYHSPLLTSESYGWWFDGDNSSARDAKYEKEHDRPRDLHRWPLLSSESYGWWYGRAFGSRDSRFDHHNRDLGLLRSHEIIHWQDQKLSPIFHPSFAGYS